MSWTNDYIGIPWLPMGRDRSGVDCWGLFRLVYKEHYEIELPSYTESYDDPYANLEVGQLIVEETTKEWLLITEQQEGDGILFDVKGEPSHTAIYVEPGLMLHTRRVTGSCIERYDTALWQSRLIAFYRHPERDNVL